MTLLPSWVGTRAQAADGTPLGRVADVLYDARCGWPEWLVLQTRDGIVHAPYAGVRQGPTAATLAVATDVLRAAPRPAQLTTDAAAALRAHFGVRGGCGPWVGIAAEPQQARLAA